MFDEAHLRRVLKNYASYYNEVWTGGVGQLVEKHLSIIDAAS